MTQLQNVELIFKNLTDRFDQLSTKVESMNAIITEIGSEFSDSLEAISQQIVTLTETLQDILKISDLKLVQEGIYDMVETFQTELDPDKFKSLLADLTKSVNKIKAQSKQQKSED
jgi:hypothetical protein